MHDITAAAAAGGFWNRVLPVKGDLREHGAFKRLKLALLSIGVAVILVANVTFLG